MWILHQRACVPISPHAFFPDVLHNVALTIEKIDDKIAVDIIIICIIISYFQANKPTFLRYPNGNLSISLQLLLVRLINMKHSSVLARTLKT